MYAGTIVVSPKDEGLFFSVCLLGHPESTFRIRERYPFHNSYEYRVEISDDVLERLDLYFGTFVWSLDYVEEKDERS